MKKMTVVFFSMIWCLGCSQIPEMKVKVRNTLAVERSGETVEIAWKVLEAGLKEVAPEEVIVCDSAGKEMVSQVIYRGNKLPQALIFQVTVGPETTESYRVRKGIPSVYVPQVHGRFVPERKDDFAWENEKVGYRMYGPALEATGEISNGLDVWVKCTDELMLEDWYKNGDYHRNHGKGMDGYTVGRTLGAGAMAPLTDGKLVLGHNFITYELVDEGPLRIGFCLHYAPFRVGDTEVTESRTITLDAGSHFNRIEESYEGLEAGKEIAAGIVLRPEGGERLCDSAGGILGYWEPQNRNNGEDNGHTAVGVFFPGQMTHIWEKDGHLLAVGNYERVPFVYYAGTGWSLGDIKEAEDWFGLLKAEKMKLENPLEIEIESDCFH